MRRQLKKILIMLSSITFIRKTSPFLADFYAAFVLGNTTKQMVVTSTYAGLKRTLFFWRWAPRKYTGGALLNLMGLQFLRYGFYNLRYLARAHRSELGAQCRQVGLVTVPAVLDRSMVGEVLEFYRKHGEDAQKHFEDFTELVLCNTKGPTQADSAYAALADRLLNHYGLSARGRDLTGVDLRIYPFIAILHYKSFVDRPGQSDGQNTPHADVFYPSFKLFVYLNEVGVQNGAFHYLLGSHRFSLRNAINAYKDSLQYYFKGGKRQLYPVDATASLGGEGYQWFPVCGHPGDGVFFNVQGVHKRGDFLKDTYRERLVLLVDFRQAEVPIQGLAANA
jgi:hypothetical protein